MLGSLITSKTRLRLLVKFFINAANDGYLRGLATEMDESTNAIRKELNNLNEAGFINKQQENRNIVYSANTKHPMFSILQKLIRNYIGLDKIIENIVERTGEVEEVYLLGDYVKGIESISIEVLVLGKAIDNDYVMQLVPKVEKEIDKKIKLIINENVPVGALLVYKA